MLNYPITLTPDSNGTYLVGFPDLPEVNSVGDDLEDALRNAVDALETALDIYFEQKLPIPAPSAPAKGQYTVASPLLDAAKLQSWNQACVERRLNS